MLLIMVGKKTGREANETLMLRKIRAWSHGRGLPSVRNVEDFVSCRST